VRVWDPDWEERAACRGEDASLFFGPNRSEPPSERETREMIAKAICARCPVMEPCRDVALRQGEVYGVWGGLGEAERRTLLARRREAVG
jgi:WhiB family transcriptional regulator, redox-sensing transcriptional regulator